MLNRITISSFSWLKLLLFIVSPTRLLANYLKVDLDTERHVLLIKGLNTTWLLLDCLILAVFVIDNVIDYLCIYKLIDITSSEVLRFELLEMACFIGLALYNRVFNEYKLMDIGKKNLWIVILFLTVLLSSSIVVYFYKENFAVNGQNFKLMWNEPTSFLFTVSIVFWYAFSHTNEVFIAFYNDVFDKLNINKTDKEKKHGINYDDRIRLALRSYIGLIIEYGIIYYVMCFFNYKSIVPCSTAVYFEKGFNTFVDALYFSGVTIMTLGYGDFSPSNWFSRLISVCEVLNGMLLVVVTFAVYVSLHLSELNKKEDK